MSQNKTVVTLRIFPVLIVVHVSLSSNLQDGRGSVLRQLLRQEVWEQGEDADQGHHGHRRRDVLGEGHSAG